MRQSVRAFAYLASLVLVAFGCAKGNEAEDPDDTNKIQGASSFCEGYCARLHTCDEGKDEKTCTNSCTNANAATLPKLRGDIVDLMSSCIDDADCKSVLAGGVIATCSDEATAKVSPSDAATSFCDARAKSAKKCDKTVETATCLTTAKLFNDAALADAEDCTAKACADIDECIEAALGSLKSTGVSSTSGDDDDTSSTDAGKAPTCTAVDTSTACGKCQASNCCAEATACQKSTDCVDLITCYGQATSSTDLADCDDFYSKGVSLGTPYYSCLTSSCAEECTATTP